jgi:altronate dehydratase large subunit
VNILGYRRSDGTVGIRNHVLLLSTVVCANLVAEKIASMVRGTVPFCHSNGCGQVGEDLRQTHRTLAGVGKNPNVAAVLVIGLGCESIPAELLCGELQKAGKEAAFLNVQECGGSEAAARHGARIASAMVESMDRRKTEADLSCLTVSVRCGGSDATSGLAANPVVGIVSDLVVAGGGTVIMSGSSELVGAEHIMRRRAASRAVEHDFDLLMGEVNAKLRPYAESLAGTQPGLGNIRGGITTIEEKSLGCMSLGGSAVLSEVLRYAERPSVRGLVFMDTPGVGVEANTAAQAAGAHVILFTTGCGSCIGAPVSPVIKVTANRETFAGMGGNMDFDASPVLTGGMSVQEAGAALFDKLLRVCSGGRTKSELLGHREAVITRIGPAI